MDSHIEFVMEVGVPAPPKSVTFEDLDIGEVFTWEHEYWHEDDATHWRRKCSLDKFTELVDGNIQNFEKDSILQNVKRITGIKMYRDAS